MGHYQRAICIFLLWYVMAGMTACGGGGSGGSSGGAEQQAEIVLNQEISPERCLPDLSIYTASPERPVISLQGAKVVTLGIGESYIDAGATALDEQSGDLSPDIRVFGLDDVDTRREGDYMIRYEVSDQDQNEALAAYRIVRVLGEQMTKTSKRFFTEIDAPWEYIESLPVNMGIDSSERFPLLIVNHGWSHSKRFDSSGVMSLMNDHSMVDYLESDLSDGSLPYIILTPQRCWSDFDQPQVFILDAFVEWALRNYPVDERRVYMTGLSMGGWATWEYLRTHSNKIAAAAPMSGGGRASQICSVAPTPIWAFTARNDNVVPAQDVINTVAALQQCVLRSRAEPKLTVFERGGHVIDDNVFSLNFIHQGESEYDIYDQSLFDWLLEHELPAE